VSQEWVFKEVSSIANSSFRFMSKQAPMSFCTNVAQNLHMYQPEHALTGPRLYWQYKPEAISQLLSLYVRAVSVHRSSCLLCWGGERGRRREGERVDAHGRCISKPVSIVAGWMV
jgi:hypothetical protein